MSAEDAPPPPTFRQLRRPLEGRVLSGVASGLGHYIGMDPVVVRIGFVALTFAAGLGLALYLMFWVTVPAEGSNESIAEALLRRVGSSPPWVRVVLGALVLILLLRSIAEGSGIVSGLILIAVGVLLFRRTAAMGMGGPAPAPAASPEAAAPSYWSVSRPDAARWAPPATPPRPSRPPSILGRVTLAVMLLAVGAVAAFDLLDVLDVTAEQRIALALTIAGAGLVIGARWGHARWLIVLGVALLPPLMVANLLGATATGRVGELFERPQTLSAVQDEYRLLAGASRLDLSDVDFAQQPTAVTASVAMGELVVVVPAEARVEVDAELRAGELDLFGEDTDGANLRRVVVQEGVEGGGRLELDIDGGVGTVTVRRGAERNPS